MQSTRRFLALAIVGACAVAAAAATHLSQACILVIDTAAACVLSGLKLFHAPKPELGKLPNATTALTARERHDVNADPGTAPTISPRWRMCPSV